MEQMDAAIQRPFRAIIFDWDGTAVADRREVATALATLITALLDRRVRIVVVTGTNVGHLERQLVRHIPASRRHPLVLCTNRGSEVYGFDRRGEMVRRRLRVATAAEDRALTRIAQAVHDALAASTGLAFGIVSNRLNRRKIDLIPLPAWSDPPKARIAALIAAVEARLRGAGFTGGLGRAIALTRASAREHGLPDARITSDVKHIEVGLTDKGDAVARIARTVLRRARIRLTDVLIAGDEFGPVAEFAGSDDRMRAEAPGATIVSVGVEPNGVPDGVLHLGGGPERFRALLADQVARWECCHRHATRARKHASLVPPPTTDPHWRFDEAAHDHVRELVEHETESRFAVGNGFIGMRGSLEQPTQASRPRTYVAGLFRPPASPDDTPALVPIPDWLPFEVLVDGTVLIPSGTAQVHARTLDVRSGMLFHEWLQQDARGRSVRVRSVRLASLARRALAIQCVEMAVDAPVAMELRTHCGPADDALVAAATNANLRLWRVRGDAHVVAMAEQMQLADGGHTAHRVPDGERAGAWCWLALPGGAATFVHLLTAARGRDPDETAASAGRALHAARRRGVQAAIAAHRRAWQRRWEAAAVTIDGDDAVQRTLRFALYHLISAADPGDEHISIAARGFTGDGYRGHVFWDTEIFLLPFYIFTWPAAARALLMYRYHTLPAAREKASQLGYRGALYAWESTDTGAEATPEHAVAPDGRIVAIRCGHEEHHISADVAYAIWQYWDATRDVPFLLDAGAEILLETARFWGSRATPGGDGRYHIRGVIGPDEYHEGVDDNAFTNAMARWNLERGVEVAALLARRWPRRWRELCARIGLADDEVQGWRAVADGLAIGQRPGSDLIEQFAGFFQLEEIDLTAYAHRRAPLDVVLGPERVGRSQVSKQADVVMVLALLWDRYPQRVRAANFRYYAARCGHGSSLSPAIHALVAARLGEIDDAVRHFREAAAIDLADTMGNGAAGIHMGALGGLWQAVVFGFAGVSFGHDGLHIAPHLPRTWRALAFPLRWRGRLLRIAIDSGAGIVAITIEQGRPLAVAVGERRATVVRGAPVEFEFSPTTGDATGGAS